MSSDHRLSVIKSAKAILAVPNEIASQILEDVQLYRILQMAASLTDPSEFRAFISVLLSLPRAGGSFFPTDEHTLLMVELYRKYIALTLNCRKPITPAKSPLSMSFNSSRQLDAAHLRVRRNSQRDWLVNEIWRMLRDLQWSEAVPHPDTIVRGSPKDLKEVESYHEAVKVEARNFTRARAKDIGVMKRVYADYPDLLKRSSDPNVEARPNHGHIKQGLETYVRRYQRDEAFPYKRGCYLYRQPYYPLVPLDGLLQEFTEFVQKVSGYLLIPYISWPMCLPLIKIRCPFDASNSIGINEPLSLHINHNHVFVSLLKVGAYLTIPSI